MEVSVLHNFEMPTYCNRIEVTQDEATVIAAGAYKPRITAFDLIDHTEKFERNTDDEIIRISILGEDWKKLALLHSLGKIEFHSQYGKHYVIDLPQQCREMKTDHIKSEILTAGNSSEVFRFSTAQGKFLPSFNTELAEVESISLSKTHSLCLVTGDSGKSQFFDSRSNSSVKTFSTNSSPITSSCFSEDGILLGVGSAQGLISLYDLRSSSPILEKDHNYDLPIKKIKIQGKSIISMDQCSLKIWNSSSGKTHQNIHPDFKISDFSLSKGIIFLGGDTQKMKTYYAPSLGSFPKWCSHLEGSTEEIEEAKKEIYFSKFRFLTEQQITQLNLKKEIGKSIKPHIHGYLVPIDLYEKNYKFLI
ncbi:ribosome biogenesis protein ENP2 [Nematocida sp. LUAm3]|nr:ribosome biogenesis protein ENP2 [Nematocida sp. LUAm3]KAI5176000.1 ribosome biogenesis protein ENP2 [Nematocida sp. LUAm2]KAI5179096.1 ribosome biogenesis protein ENP2 [Nematocida sp. LUAm1]